jgi:hypothetical protein
MKTQVMMYMTVAYIDTLKAKAADLGVPYSVLNEFLGSLALQKLPADRLKAWARTASAQGPASVRTPKENKVLGALRHLTTTEIWRHGLGDIADAAGLPPREAWRALCALEGRGEVVGARGQELDRWGRPLESWWRLANAGPGGATNG